MITPVLSIYLSTTSAVFTPAGHVNILQRPYGGIHGFWFTSIHDSQTIEMNLCLKKSRHTRMDDQRKDVINPERLPQRNRHKQLQTQRCLPMMWKILTAEIREEFYNSLISCGPFSEDEKERPQVDLRHRRAMIHWSMNPQREQESKRRRKNLAMAWIDDKKACNMVP